MKYPDIRNTNIVIATIQPSILPAILETCGGDANLTIDNIHQIEKMQSDMTFLVPMDLKVKEFAKHMSLENIPVYYFRYR